MAEGSYEYEVMRAELLGVEKPNYEEFLRKKEEEIKKIIEEEELEIENLKAAENQNDELKGVSGKLDELNTLLSGTKKKINNLKFRFGLMSNFMRNRFGSSSSVSSIDNENSCSKIPSEAKEDNPEINSENVQKSNTRKSDLSKALDNHVDKLDGLLEKAERAEISMKMQRKQMRSYLK